MATKSSKTVPKATTRMRLEPHAAFTENPLGLASPFVVVVSEPNCEYRNCLKIGGKEICMVTEERALFQSAPTKLTVGAVQRRSKAGCYIPEHEEDE